MRISQFFFIKYPEEIVTGMAHPSTYDMASVDG